VLAQGRRWQVPAFNFAEGAVVANGACPAPAAGPAAQRACAPKGLAQRTGPGSACRAAQSRTTTRGGRKWNLTALLLPHPTQKKWRQPGGCAQDTALLGDLDALQRAARDGVVHLTEASFARFADGPRRPYHLVVFLTASHLLDKTALGLRELRHEFGLLAKARGPPAAA